MTQHDPNRPAADDVDDLTRFLDEDFGTDEVDLFEFTSGEVESPLTQIKSIILGLDWEITDESLQDLADEIEHLRYLEQFEHDKVSQVYLQALDKIGNYLLIEGAYAHPNSIKLLLTLFYDFEKIISSDLITGAEITALLKSDVRKFKILQYQIAQKHGATVPEASAAAADLPLTDHKTLLEIHASILEIDWEVTDEALAHLSENLSILGEQFADNRYIQIVIKGLSTLTTYIDEERARTHPESFTLLHHFFEALETLVDDTELDDENSQKILINCVNRLNTLKSLISQTPQELSEEAITPVGEEAPPAPEPEEAPEPVAETAVEKEEDTAEIPGALDKEQEADVLDVELPVDDSGEVAPALFDEGEGSGFVGTDEAEEAPSEELTDKLDSFFGSEDEAPPPPPEEPTEAEEIPTPEIEGVAGEKEAEDELDVELPVDDSGEVAPALFDEGEEGAFTKTAEDEEAPIEELTDKLDSFFGSEEAVPPPEEEVIAEEPVADEAPALDEPPVEEEETVAEEAIPGVAAEDEEDDVLDVDLPVDDAGEVAPALFDEGEEGGFTQTDEDEAPPEELEEKLQFFFGDSESEESFQPEAIEEKVAQEKAKEKELADEEQKRKEEEVETLSVTPALAGEFEESGFTAETEEETPPEELSDKLDSFFGGEETPEEAPSEEEPEPEALFGEELEEDDEEELLLTPALAADEEVIEETLSEESTELTAPEEPVDQLEKMRADFQEREQTLLDEIATLKEEIESLKSQL